MSKNKPIGVRVVYPTTPEGIAAMNERLEQINTWLLCSFLDKIDAPTSAKLAYVESLNGIAPWATVRGNSENIGAERERRRPRKNMCKSE